VKRRELLIYMPFGPLALMDIAQAATKNVASKPPAAAPLATPAVAAPYISAAQMVQGLLSHHLQPGADALVQAAQALSHSLADPSRPWAQHRPLWVRTMLVWENLAAVAVGPLLERRSARAIDFWPTRPAQIRRLLDGGLDGITSVHQLDTVGATARGLPALEWLLWKTDGAANIPRYAHLLAQQIEAEALALQAGYQQLNDPERDDTDAWAIYSEWFGQALGGLDQLRIKKMVMETRGKDSSVWVRGLSGQTTQAWLAQAHGLQAFFVGSPAAQAATQAASPGWPVAGSLNSLLLGRGYLRDSHTLQELTDSVLRAVTAAHPNNAGSLRRATAALSQLSTLINTIAGEMLNIPLGFTDADGD
jgi:uncharacterized protein